MPRSAKPINTSINANPGNKQNDIPIITRENIQGIIIPIILFSMFDP